MVNIKNLTLDDEYDSNCSIKKFSNFDLVDELNDVVLHLIDEGESE